MALSPSSALVISTNANPRERPVSRSVMMLTLSICPYGSNAWRSSSSVVWKSKLPTKMFFTRSPRGYGLGLSVGGFGERDSPLNGGRSREQSNEEASIAGPLRACGEFGAARFPDEIESNWRPKIACAAHAIMCCTCRFLGAGIAPSLRCEVEVHRRARRIDRRVASALFQESTAFRCPVSATVVEAHRAEMAVVLLPAVGTVQVASVRPARRVATRDRNVAAAGAGNQKHLRRCLNLGGTRFRSCRGLGHGD
jgi:hypothetical protein